MQTLTCSKSNRTLAAMVAILLLAAALRIHDLNAQGLWGDEGWSIWLARGDSLRDLTMTMVVDHHGPIFSALLRAWDEVAGWTVFALRYLTVLFSVSSIALLYLLGRELFSPAAGVFAALAFTLMDKHVVLTQEVRDYPMVFFVMIGIAYFYVRWLRRPRGGSAFGFVLLSVIGLYLHYYCYMVNLAILVHGLITLRGRERWKHFLALNALIATAFFPWVFIVIHQFINTPVDGAVLTIHGMPFNRATLEYLASESLGDPLALYGLLLLTGWLVPLTARPPGPMGHIARSRRLSGTLLAALWFGLPIITTAALHTRYPLLTDRNISVIMPAIALLVGHGMTAFEKFGRTWVITLVVVNGLLVTSSFYVKPPWRQMADDIAARHVGDEPILVEVGGEHAALWYHLIQAIPDLSEKKIVALLPAEETNPVVISLYDYRKRYRELYMPHVKAVLDKTSGLWIAYWGSETVNNDTLDLIEAEGFVRTARLAYSHHGSPIFAFRYDRAAILDNLVAAYGDVITLHKIDMPASARPGETIPVRLWWSAQTPPGVDYSVSVFLLDSSGALQAQNDSYPANGAAPTSGWTPSVLIFDGHSLPLPDDLAPGEYTVGVKLYTYWDGVILPTVAGGDYAIVGNLTVE